MPSFNVHLLTPLKGKTCHLLKTNSENSQTNFVYFDIEKYITFQSQP